MAKEFALLSGRMMSAQANRKPKTENRRPTTAALQAPPLGPHMENIQDRIKGGGESCGAQEDANRERENPGEKNVPQCFCL